MTRFLSVESLKKTRARTRTTADPCGMTNKRQATADTTESTNAGPSTGSFAKCADDRAQSARTSIWEDMRTRPQLSPKWEMSALSTVPDPVHIAGVPAPGKIVRSQNRVWKG